jgi:hypothetical protein
MKKIKIMTLHANESVSKEEAKGISCGKHKNLSFRFILIVLSCVVLLNSCTKEDYDVTGNDDVIENTDNSSLEISDFRNWFESQTIVKGLINYQKLNWDNAEMKLMPDGKSTQVSIEIYNDRNSSGNDSIIKLHIAHVKNSFIGGVKVFSFYNQEYAHVNYYNLSGKILEEGLYYAPKQLYMSLQRYTYRSGIVRLKSGDEYNEYCNDILRHDGTATPIVTGVPNPTAYNCHTYVWGAPSKNNTCYMQDYPLWNDCPNISGSGYSPESTPQVGDRWVSYGYDSKYGDNHPIHSAIVVEVQNGEVTKVRAKCGMNEIYEYHPDCNHELFSSYKTDSIVYYRKQ